MRSIDQHLSKVSLDALDFSFFSRGLRPALSFFRAALPFQTNPFVLLALPLFPLTPQGSARAKQLKPFDLSSFFVTGSHQSPRDTEGYTKRFGQIDRLKNSGKVLFDIARIAMSKSLSQWQAIQRSYQPPQGYTHIGIASCTIRS